MAKSSSEQPKEPKMTVNDLPAEIVGRERVMFLSGSPGAGRLVTDGDASAERAQRLSRILGWKISLVSLDQAPEDARNAFPNIVGMCSVAKTKVEQVMVTPPEEDSAPSPSRKKRVTKKPE